jgi:hypothetical protein
LIERRIYLIRGQRVVLDSDLAELYQVPRRANGQKPTRFRLMPFYPNAVQADAFLPIFTWPM